MSIELRNRETLEALRAFPARLAQDKGALRYATYGASRAIAEAVKSRAPVDTGRLRRSVIVVKRGGRSERRGYVAYVVTHKRGRRHERQRGRQYVEARSKWDAYYAPFVEYGTSKSPAQPFFRPALSAAADDAVRVAAERVHQYVDRRAGRGR